MPTEKGAFYRSLVDQTLGTSTGPARASAEAGLDKFLLPKTIGADYQATIITSKAP